MKKHLGIICLLFAVSVIVTPRGMAADGSLVDWPAIFNPDGTVQNLGGGLEAVFLPDNVSAGVATDMTALDTVNNMVYNGAIATAHDLGNGYVYAERDALGNLAITAAVERLAQPSDTYVDMEFNQAVVAVYSGEPWPILGSRTPNDVKIRFNFIAGNLAGVQVGRWNGSAFILETFAVPSQAGCFVASADLEFCIGAPVAGLPPVNDDVWDRSFNMVQVPDPDSFLQARLNIGTLLGTNLEFSSILLKTPQDISLGSFKAMGHWGALNAVAAQ